MNPIEKILTTNSSVQIVLVQDDTKQYVKKIIKNSLPNLQKRFFT
jgi:hypothetical protein